MTDIDFILQIYKIMFLQSRNTFGKSYSTEQVRLLCIEYGEGIHKD